MYNLQESNLLGKKGTCFNKSFIIKWESRIKRTTGRDVCVCVFVCERERETREKERIIYGL